MYLGEDWNSRRLRKTLIEEYPYLQPRNVFTNKIPEDFDYQHIVGEYDLPEGWMVLFLQCCEDIKAPLEKAGQLHEFRFTQIKEKFGQMRLYTNGAPEEVHDILAKYEFLSEQVCCKCSKPAVAMTRGWICPYCEEHIKKYTEHVEIVDPIEVQTSYIKRCWSAKGTTETIINCSDEWNRYLKQIGCKEY